MSQACSSHIVTYYLPYYVHFNFKITLYYEELKPKLTVSTFMRICIKKILISKKEKTKTEKGNTNNIWDT